VYVVSATGEEADALRDRGGPARQLEANGPGRPARRPVRPGRGPRRARQRAGAGEGSRHGPDRRAARLAPRDEAQPAAEAVSADRPTGWRNDDADQRGRFLLYGGADVPVLRSGDRLDAVLDRLARALFQALPVVDGGGPLLGDGQPGGGLPGVAGAGPVAA